MLKTLKFIW